MFVLTVAIYLCIDDNMIQQVYCENSSQSTVEIQNSNRYVPRVQRISFETLCVEDSPLTAFECTDFSDLIDKVT